jgi:hypothetical protein
MPLLRYFLYVGGALLALLFVVDANLPQLAVTENAGPHLPVIYLYADRTGPERVVFDTSDPMFAHAPVAKADAAVPAKATVVNVAARVRDAFAQLPPAEAAKLQSVEPKKPATPPQRKIAKRHTAPPVRMVYRQPQFDWFGPQQRYW